MVESGVCFFAFSEAKLVNPLMCGRGKGGDAGDGKTEGEQRVRANGVESKLSDGTAHADLREQAVGPKHDRYILTLAT